MGDRSGINWTNSSFSPWIGCSKVSPGCANCYAERDWDNRFKRVTWGPHGTRSVVSHASWRNPVRWNKQQKLTEEVNPEACLNRPRVFCSPLADIFEDWKGPMLSNKGNTLNHEWHNLHRGRRLTMDDVRVRLFRLINETPYLNWLILTKRPENIRRMMGANGTQFKNVWLGVSVENQETADTRIPELLKCRDLSPVLFLSCEPLLGPIDFRLVPGMNRVDRSGLVDWVIAGGESGPCPRASDPNWFRSLRDQCRTANVPFFFKQWGEIDEHGVNVGKHNAGRLLDGVLHDSFPRITR